MEELAAEGLKNYAPARAHTAAKKPKASRDLSGSSARTARRGRALPWAMTACTARQGDVGGTSGKQDMSSVFNTRAAGTHAFGGFRAFQKYGVGAGLTPASISQKSDATTQNYWLRRLGLVQNQMGAALAQRKDTSKSPAAYKNEQGSERCPSDPAEESTAAMSPASMAKAARDKRHRRRTSRSLAAHCLSPRAMGKGVAKRAGDAHNADQSAMLASQARRRQLLAQLTGEERDALLMREVLLQAHRATSRAPSTLSAPSDGESFDLCGGSSAPSKGSASSCLAAGVSGVVSVSSRAQSIQSDNGYETRSIASGSSWSLLSALQLEPLSNAASAPNLSPAADSERYSRVLLMSDGESGEF